MFSSTSSSSPEFQKWQLFSRRPVGQSNIGHGLKALVLTVTVLCCRPMVGQYVPESNGKTALDRYIAAPDDAYRWELVHTSRQNGHTTFVLDMVSQTWLTAEEVNRPEWRHWLIVVKPDQVRSTTGMLYVGSGSNRGNAPRSANPMVQAVAMATGTVVAELKMIPNQPLIFHNDGQERYEDDLIGYTWDQYLKTGDERWPARLPMVKSVVRGMDSVQALLKSEQGGNIEVDKFVVAGASKRGWTTWLTAAVDERVTAIVPIVIDVLNADLSMRHHYAAYGFWAPAIKDYVQHEIMHRRNETSYRRLLDLVDPFAYRQRLTLPKCVVSSTGDEFFLPDSSQFYFDDLQGEKHLCYVPNSNHSLQGTDALDSIIAFHHCIAHGVPRPTVAWEYVNATTVKVTGQPAPKRVRLWQAVNADTRDFRIDTIGRSYRSSTVEPNGDGKFVAEIELPEKGWRAYFVQCEFDVGSATPLRLTTPIRVVPEELPYADKEPPLFAE